MGVAAYNRGSRLIRTQLDAQQRDPIFVLMDDLNALPKYPDAGTPWGPVRIGEGHGGWWVSCPTTGYGYWYKTLHEVMRRWRITITGYVNNEWHALPNEAVGKLPHQKGHAHGPL